ncbi:protoporphyrinogen oxidase [Cohnella lubricantis]|uniref:Coproporphyrinogen III oxidase n=1 Tax=Cohnella lubricantis TaxID=2163172 RepID=A0A841TK48_9BACL|nr:protoporphyrinogen oxidase [Cohnella lubricantis]MBB6679570.1 protoporphyrinogen oxidase [Cohnella lubricantis]MBP2120372.1 oxygen-dependent protoporphyrinogen oxidase [Cohnella lubricantis]
MRRDVRRVAVLGGGITGLSAAFYLKRIAKEQGRNIEVTVLEKSDRFGGKVNTLRKNGFVIERGPDSFLGRKLPMLRLARELDLLDELVGTNPQATKTYLAYGGALHPMPKGLNLGIPNDLGAFARNSVVSPLGKLRALDELRLPPKTDDGDESVGGFLERRLGREMVERIGEPLLAGIHAGDLYKLGLKATFPQFAEMERKYGSVIRGMIEARKKAPVAGAKAAEARSAAVGGAKIPPTAFLTFRRGLSTLIEALEERLRAEGCELRIDAEVTAIRKPADGAGGAEAAAGKATAEIGADTPAVGAASAGTAYRLELADGSAVEADAVLLTLPAFATGSLLAPHVDASALTTMDYASVANIVLAYDARDFDHKLDGSGFLVPHGEGRAITASTWTSSKWGNTAPAGKRLIRCYVGHSTDASALDLSDEELTAAVKRDLRELMGLTAEPEFIEITRLRRSMPQYPVGHTDRIAALRHELAERLPGIYATGAPFDGVGLPDCVEMAKAAAEQMLGD